MSWASASAWAEKTQFVINISSAQAWTLCRKDGNVRTAEGQRTQRKRRKTP
nr:MAG TPA: hypothetical protein [Caudoviricetes sp.]